MVIDRNNTVAPLFWYVYKPLVSSQGEDNYAVGGFHVALYPNHTLVFCKYNGLNQVVQYNTFPLSPEVTGRYMMILENESWWIGELPREIHVSGQPTSQSVFGFTWQHPLFICEDINTLVREPFNSKRGMYARRLRGMLEHMHEMLFPWGIELDVDYFDWKWHMIRPLEAQAEYTQPTMGAWNTGSYAQNQFPQDGAAYYENQRAAQ